MVPTNALVAEKIGLTTAQMRQRVLDAADASFLPPAEKRELKRVVRASFVREAGSAAGGAADLSIRGGKVTPYSRE